MADEAMDSYLYSAYTPYSYRYQPPKGKGPPGAWRQRGTYFSGYGDTAAAAAAEYFDNYQRAQLKAILSQVNPSLTPRLRKANTKEVGVQVNPRQDASVQCSLGPRTLLRRRPGPGLPSLRPREQEQGSPATATTRPVRFPRTIAVYSPMASRRLTTFLEEPEDAGQEAAEEEPEEAAAEEEEQQRTEAAAVRASWEQPPGSSAEPQEPRLPQQQEAAEELEEEAVAAPLQEGPVETPERQAGQPQAAAPQEQEPGQGKTRLRFQVYFRQFCRTCQKSYNPYRVEDITCQSCKQTRCTCPVKVRHVDPKRPHRQDLCGRCKGKRLSCDSTFSFKYII
ncbi:zygote arrest protein 1 isoform X2 [Gopherus evgoodei]|uniref:zygote arrest protein 1 isoform X2 n=1 Tax=Gopherus evgoodei TaxID=1825980 RepID=UPI0011CF91DA|nr:zygote arrest protein 1 isoform X2 [Gopherus evgoodei]